MVESLNLFRELYRKWKARRGQPGLEVSEVFRFKYTCFRDLLDSNAQLLVIITDMEEKLKGEEIFGMSYVRSQAARAAFHAFRMIKNLDVLSGHRYANLYGVLEGINALIKAELEKKKEAEIAAFVLPYRSLTKEMVDWVGGKNANLGEVKNRVGLPTPQGFAITTRAWEAFLGYGDLVGEINKRKMELDPQDLASVKRVSEDIQALILEAPLPPELASDLEGAYAGLAREVRPAGPPPLVSIRSSAIGEDSDLSFAGQYLTLLNLPREDMLTGYKRVLASLYTPRAVAYRLNKGIRDEDAAMSVAVLEMVDSVAAGVMYSRHPYDLMADHVVITAVWGLGPYAVDGTITPDMFDVAKDDDLTILGRKIAQKPLQLAVNPEGGLQELPVPPEQQEAPCLTDDQVKTLARYAVKLEEHYKSPQDIEWAMTRGGRLLVLQSRPLRLESPEEGARRTPLIPGYAVLLEGGEAAHPGVGSGPAFHVNTDQDLVKFPEGAVLVARHSSPKFVLVMPRARAIVTDSGSVAGHMAAVAREFKVPSLLGTQTATAAIPPGVEVTVDAYSGRVYQGRVPELLALQEDRKPHMQDTPVYEILRRVADNIVPLHLLDPKSPDFGPQACKTFHDLGRLVHEYSYTEMFRISDLAADRGGGALKLDMPIPLDLYVIDLGKGLTGVARGGDRATLDNVASVPFRALLTGMLDPDLQAFEPRPVAFSGLMSVMREQMLAAPQYGERFGEKSYALISEKYLNFSSRVGYHYSVLDAYCGATVNKNYITFSFKGGAADEVRRSRRVRAIALVLLALDFTVDVKGDRVDARFAKYEAPVIAEKLEKVGRLLVFTRQMDMLMVSEASVEAVAENFLAGNYRWEPEALPAER